MKIIHINNPSKIDLFNKQMNNENNIMVMFFYMDGCHHCDVLKPKWNKLVDDLKHEKLPRENMAIAKINSDLMSLLNTPPVNQFPTIKMKTQEDLKEYQGPHEEKNIKEWIDSIISSSTPKPQSIERIRSPESPVRTIPLSLMQDIEPIIGKTIRISSKPRTRKKRKHRRRRRPKSRSRRSRRSSSGLRTPRFSRSRRSTRRRPKKRSTSTRRRTY